MATETPNQRNFPEMNGRTRERQKERRRRRREKREIE